MDNENTRRRVVEERDNATVIVEATREEPGDVAITIEQITLDGDAVRTRILLPWPSAERLFQAAQEACKRSRLDIEAAESG